MAATARGRSAGGDGVRAARTAHERKKGEEEGTMEEGRRKRKEEEAAEEEEEKDLPEMWQCAVRLQLHPGPVAAYVRSIDCSTGGDAHEPYRGGGDTHEPRRSHEKWALEFPTCLIQ
ncbi:hypothetical protein BHE74_00037036 [Ensete ventricosum]|nr:hypothetical protein BHE74_00037036 [Ensete ventricosum]